ncbi:MAG: hypothetical protein JSS72_07500 [Armatimonadetes bacterium]|nr:hypothetical protein [Armatimonadota bacterium]
MKRPSKKEIEEAVKKLKGESSGQAALPEPKVGQPTEKKTSQRIRKQGI